MCLAGFIFSRCTGRLHQLPRFDAPKPRILEARISFDDDSDLRIYSNSKSIKESLLHLCIRLLFRYSEGTTQLSKGIVRP